MNQTIAHQIDDLIRAEVMTSQALSNALFGPMGLFGKLAANEQERRALSQTPLFERAQARISELRRIEHREYQEELNRRCSARNGQAGANPAVPVPNGPANGTAAEQPAKPALP